MVAEATKAHERKVVSVCPSLILEVIVLFPTRILVPVPVTPLSHQVLLTKG